MGQVLHEQEVTHSKPKAAGNNRQKPAKSGHARPSSLRVLSALPLVDRGDDYSKLRSEVEPQPEADIR